MQSNGTWILVAEGHAKSYAKRDTNTPWKEQSTLVSARDR